MPFVAWPTEIYKIDAQKLEESSQKNHTFILNIHWEIHVSPIPSLTDKRTDIEYYSVALLEKKYLNLNEWSLKVQLTPGHTALVTDCLKNEIMLALSVSEQGKSMVVPQHWSGS